MQPFAVRHLALALPLIAATACVHTTLEAHAALPPGAPGTPLFVFTRDFSLRGYRLANAARLVAATHDSLSFAVRVVHGIDDVADPDRWVVTLEDSSGHTRIPAQRSDAHLSRLSIEFQRFYQFGDVDGPPRVAKLIPPMMAYEGDAVYRFDGPGLGALASGRELHLRVDRHDGVTLRYDWSFRDGPIEVTHHGSNIGDPVPGEVTRVASSHELR